MAKRRIKGRSIRGRPFHANACHDCPTAPNSLAEAAAIRAMLRLTCRLAAGAANYRVDRLLEQHGPAIVLPDLRHGSA